MAFSTADEAVNTGKERQEERLKEVSMLLLIPQSTILLEGDSSESTKGKGSRKNHIS